MKYLVSLALLVALAAPPASAQSDPRLQAAVQLAAEGLSDSASAIVNRLFAVTPVSDSLYPEILYTQGAIARTTTEMQRAYRKVAVDYPASPWADDALLRLAQMDFAARNFAATIRGAEQIRADDPSSPLIPTAAYWAARAAFELGQTPAGCAWIARGLAVDSADVEDHNRLTFLQGRCSGQADSSTPAAPPTPGPWGVQVAAVSSQASANSVLTDLKAMGMAGTVVREGGNLFKVRIVGLPSREAADSTVAAVKAKLGGSPFVLTP